MYDMVTVRFGMTEKKSKIKWTTIFIIIICLVLVGFLIYFLNRREKYKSLLEQVFLLYSSPEQLREMDCMNDSCFKTYRKLIKCMVDNAMAWGIPQSKILEEARDEQEFFRKYGAPCHKERRELLREIIKSKIRNKKLKISKNCAKCLLSPETWKQIPMESLDLEFELSKLCKC